MLALFPLFNHGNYFDILDAKWIACLAPTLLFLAICVVLVVTAKMPLNKANTSYKLFMAFTVLYALSVIIGMTMCQPLQHLRISFWGLTGRYLGVMVIVPLLAAILIISKYYRMRPALGYSFGISSAIIFILQILNEFRIDLFNMWAGVPAEQLKLFSGTIGNINFNATYNCIVLSIFMAMLVVLERRQNSRTLNLLLSVLIILGFAGSICIRSNGFYLGIAATFIVLFIYTIRHMECLNRLLLLITLWVTASSMVALIYRTAEHHFELKSISKMMTQPQIIFAELTLIMALYLATQFLSPKISRILLIVAGMATLAGATWLVVAGSEAFIDPSNITDHTGHNRVYVWRRTLDMMAEYSPLGWLFGCGINEFQFAFSDFCGNEMQALGYNIFIDAHSEYLQALAATGVLGFVGYFGMIVSTLVVNIRRASRNPFALIAVACLITFLTQGLVYGPQITTTPLILILVGIFRSEITES